MNNATKTTHSLLEKAARVAGLKHHTFDGYDMREQRVAGVPHCGYQGPGWNSITNDGDGARLEGLLELNIAWMAEGVEVSTTTTRERITAIERFDDHANDKQAARRMATTRLAAALQSQQE